MTATKSGLRACMITVWYGHTRITSESLTATGDDHIWVTFAAPVSTQNLLLIGTKSGVSRVLVNYTLEPITGTITIPASFPAFDSITASYFYYLQTTGIITKNYLVKYPEHNYNLSLYGEPVYVLNKNFPYALEFDWVLQAESQRGLLTEMVENGYFVLLIDNLVPDIDGFRAFEGPIVSSEQASYYKGRPYLLPIKQEVCQFGFWSDTTSEITWN